MNSPFRSDAASWSPANSVMSDEPEAASPRRGPSLLFAITVIAAVGAATAGAVAMFFVEPSESAPEAKQTLEAEAAAVAAMAAPNLPVHKVTTKPVQPTPAAGVVASADKQDKVAAADEQKVPVEEATAEADALQQQDPRWARTNSEKTETVFASVLQPSAPAGVEAGAAATGALALADEAQSQAVEPNDDTETAAVDPKVLKPKPAAKAKPAKQPAQAAVDDDQDPAPAASAPTRTAQILKGANIRSRPKSGSGALGTVPKGASVQLVGCNAWCEIVYKGRRGYVYKDFVSGAGGGSSAKAKTSFTVSTSQPQEDQPKQENKAAADTKPKGIISSRLQ